MAEITDRRTEDTEKPRLWAVATDRFLSSWGHNPGDRAAGHFVAPVSYVAYPIYSSEDQRALTHWMEHDRSDYIRVRVNLELPRLRNGATLSLYDRPRFLIKEPHARMAGEEGA